jgi:hypothetical protein
MRARDFIVEQEDKPKIRKKIEVILPLPGLDGERTVARLIDVRDNDDLTTRISSLPPEQGWYFFPGIKSAGLWQDDPSWDEGGERDVSIKNADDGQIHPMTFAEYVDEFIANLKPYFEDET